MVATLVALPVLALISAPPASAAPDDGKLRVLLFYKTNFHASHVQARQAVNELAASVATEYGQTLEVQETDQASAFNTANLSTVDTVVFAQTGGVLFNGDQRQALETYIRGGGGYMGLHYAGWSVGESEHDVNPFYLRLVGAMSEGHPENPAVRPGKVVVKDAAHPLAAGLSADITRSDEWYDWVVNPAQNVRTILSVDESSYNSLGRQGTNHPVTWCQQIDQGRSWYTGMGHEGSAYSEPFMRTQMNRGIAYTAGLLPADCSPPKKAEEGTWSPVTPWPLMPINAALTSDGKVQSFGSVSSGCTDATPFDWTGDSCLVQGGQTQIDVWDPAVPRNLANVSDGLLPNVTYTDLFCSMQVQNPHRKSIMTVGGDDSLGGNAPNDAAIGTTSYTTNNGLVNDAPMNHPRWYPTGTTTADGDVVVQGGSRSGGPGGPGVHIPEIYQNQSKGWRELKGAEDREAYGDGGGDHTGADENRWWYPRTFVVPGTKNLFNITGTLTYELDPSGNGQILNKKKLPAGISNQGALGNPVGATSTATMYRPGKILQVGGGWWANGGGPAGARGGFTVDLTTAGGTANPVIEATQPMAYGRHWVNSTMMPDGNVFISGGSRDNNGNGGYVTTAEIWNPETKQWKTVEAPHAHARLYHSMAMLLPDGRIMIGGGGAPGPRDYRDVEYYSPAYLFDGEQLAARPTITQAPKKVGYNGTFKVGASEKVSKVTLIRNGSVTHGFNNDQNFQELQFTQAAGTNELTITAPQDSTYAAPGAYMLFVHNEAGTPSVAKILDIDPAVKLDSRVPSVVDQFEYPRLPTEWRSGTYPAITDVAPGNGRMAPWSVDNAVQLVRGIHASQGGLGIVGTHLALGNNGSVKRTLTGLDVGREYNISMRFARDSRSAAGSGDAVGQVKVGDLDTTITATTANTSQSGRAVTFGTFVDTFTATKKSEVITLAGSGTGAGLMLDDLVIGGAEPGVNDVPIHYEFEEGTGTSVANTGTDDSVGAAVLTGTTGWSETGVLGKALNLPGGTNANAVDLPDNLLQNAANFTTSFWVRPDTKGNWINLFHIGDGLGDAGSFFQIQMQTQAQGNTGLAATFKKKGSTLQERVYATPTRDVDANKWNHVVFTREGTTGTLFLNGQQIATRNNLTLTMTDVGPTANNWLGRNGYPDPAFDGLMDDVRLYRSAISPADISSMYAEGAALRTTTTVTVDPVSPSPFAEPLTVSATVKDEAAASAQGTAELWVAGARVGDAVPLVSGAVTFPDELTLRPGNHEIEVRFLGADGWRNSTAKVTHTVERPPPGVGIPIHYKFDEGTGTTAANSGADITVGPATLGGSTTFTQQGKFGTGVSLPGGASTTGNHVRLPNNITEGMDEEFSVSVWARPNALPNWVPLLQIGSSTDTFFLLQSSTQASGATGFAATFKQAGNGTQERLVLGGGNDLPLNQWTHVVFTQSGNVGKIYFDGVLKATRNDFNFTIADVGINGTTTANFLGGTSWPDPRFNGLVDDFRIYGYELTGEQVTEVFTTVPDSPDTVAPTTTATFAPAQANGDNGWYTTAPSFSLAATDAGGSGVDTTEYRIGSTGAWTAYTGTPVALTTDGTVEIGFRSKDKAGNTEVVKTSTVKLDRVAPATTAAVTSAGSGRVVTLTATDETSGVATREIRIGNGAWAAYTAPVTLSTPGQYVVSFRSKDNAGLVSEVGTVDVTVAGPDATAPTTELVLDPATPNGTDGWYTTAPSFTLVATDGDGSGVASSEYRIGSGAWTAYAGQPVSLNGAVDGDVQVEFRSTDEAGNVETAASRALKLDRVAPDASATVEVLGAAQSVSVTATDATSGVARVEVKVDSGAWADYTGPVAIEQPGDHTVSYRAVDKAGLVGVDRTLTLKVRDPGPSVPDLTGPTVKVNGLRTGAVYGHSQQPRVSWAVSPTGDRVKTVSVRLDGRVIKAGRVNLGAMRLGQHQLVVTAVDTAGNRTISTVEFRVRATHRDTVRLVKRFAQAKGMTPAVRRQLVQGLNKANRLSVRRPTQAVVELRKVRRNALKIRNAAQRQTIRTDVQVLIRQLR